MSTVAWPGVIARAEVGVRTRLLLIDGMRAAAATVIVLHHFAQYWPLSDSAQEVLGDTLAWLHSYARATQVFFVIGGYVMARSMSNRRWTGTEAGRFLIQRYCRLGIPYLAVLVLAIGACAVGRGWLPEAVVGLPPTLPQILAHIVFLQDILGYDSLSAGIWFVCINFQLGVVYAAMLWMRDALPGRGENASCKWWCDVPLMAGTALSAVSLFYFNLDDRWSIWCLYFFPQFFLGIVTQRASQSATGQKWFAGYVLLMAAAIALRWRWRLVTSLALALLLYFNSLRQDQRGWSASSVISYLGRTSYSLFLIHFPVMVLVTTLWVRLQWDSPLQTICGLAIAYGASLFAAEVFYRIVEQSAARLSRKFAYFHNRTGSGANNLL